MTQKNLSRLPPLDIHAQIAVELLAFPLEEQETIMVWLRGVYKADLKNFFDEERLVALQSTLNTSSIIRRFSDRIKKVVEETHTTDAARRQCLTHYIEKSWLPKDITRGLWRNEFNRYLTLFHAAYMLGSSVKSSRFECLLEEVKNLAKHLPKTLICL